MKKIKLVALTGGIAKKTGRKYYRAMFKGNLSDGTPVTKEYFLSEEVGDSCVAQGILEDVDVEIEAGINQYLGLEITQIRLAGTDNSLGEGLF